jgi:DNA-binding transcriptional LysR family regulator
LREAGVPKTIDALTGHKCTGYRSPSTGKLLPWEFKINGQIEYRNISPVFSANDPEAEMEAVIAGFGIGLIDGVNAVPRIRERSPWPAPLLFAA